MFPTSTTTPESPLPIFVRIPGKLEKCPWSGLKRSQLYKLTSGSNPKVASISLTHGNSKRGSRLVVLESLLAYIVRNGTCRGELPDTLKQYFTEQQAKAQEKTPATVATNESNLLPVVASTPLYANSEARSIARRPDEFLTTPSTDVDALTAEIRAQCCPEIPDVVTATMVILSWPNIEAVENYLDQQPMCCN